jgi:L-asparaginase
MNVPVSTIYNDGFNPRPDAPREFFLATGGTIDSAWDPASDSISTRPSSVIPSYLSEVVRLRSPWEFVQICSVDSRNLGDTQKESLIAEIVGSMHEAAIVTSGTYAMPDIANRLYKNGDFDQVSRSKRAVFTGALVPLDGFTESDAGFNLGMTFASRGQFPNGEVRVCMNGRLVLAGEISKETNTTQFRATHERFNTWEQYADFGLVTAGGTMDFKLDGLDGVVPRKKSVVPAFLRRLNLRQKISHTSMPTLQDSRAMTDEDIADLAVHISRSASDKVLVTMGIFQMQRVAQALASHSEILREKRVVLTGSRFPLAGVDESDAPFNLGFALGSMPILDKGVHIALGGQILARNEDVLDLFTPREREMIDTMRAAAKDRISQ